MQHIDEDRLQDDLTYRFEFLASFVGFGADDAACIQASAPHLGPRIPEFVEQTYTKLLEYDATARHLIPPQHGLEGSQVVQLEDLDLSHPHVQFRRDHLNRYLAHLLTSRLDASSVKYLDMVGQIHTPRAGNPDIAVPLVQMNALLGLISDILTQAVVDAPLDPDQTCATVRAFQKLLWIQNDFVSRHYANGAT